MTNKRQPRYQKGQRIANRFLVHQALMGGMGEVYLCLDEQETYPYALKTFQGSSPDLADIFKYEVVNWIALEKHPNIVRCFRMQPFDNIPFMVLEWVAGDESKGTDLRSWLRYGPLDLTLALKFTIDIVRGLQHANQKVSGIVHRDLKPDNVLVNQSHQAKITDFGLATVAQLARLDVEGTDEADMGLSRYVGGIVGTPAYMPPEQWRGEAKIDFRADVYAIGCILYELLAGRTLYTGNTLNQLREQHLNAPLPPLNSDFPPGVRAILEGCLAKRREDRYVEIEILLQQISDTYEILTGKPPPTLSDVSQFTALDYSIRGATYARLEQVEKALADYESAIGLDPTCAQAYYNRGATYTRLQRWDEALADYDKAIRLAPDDPLPYYNRGVTYSRIEHQNLALIDYDRAIQLNATFAQAYHNRGVSHATLELLSDAISDYDVAIHLDPTYAQAYYNRGRSYAHLNQHERAIVDYDVAIQLDPTSAQAYYDRAISFAYLNQYERAIADYTQTIQLDPSNAKVFSSRGMIYINVGRIKEALADYNHAIQLDPSLVHAHFNRGRANNRLGQRREALTDYDRAIQLDPTDAKIYYNRGVTYTDLMQHQQAIADYDATIRLDPTFVQAYFNRGAGYGALGQHERAIADFDVAIRLDPNDAQAYYNRGISYSELRQHQRAIADYDAAIRLNPIYAKAYYNRGTSYDALGQHERAIADYDASIRLDPTFAPAYLNKAVTLVLAGHLEEALQWGMKAAHLGAPGALELVAQVRQVMGQAPTQLQHNEQEQIIRQLMSIYQQHGEAGLRQMLMQQGIPTAQVDGIIAAIKQILGA